MRRHIPTRLLLPSLLPSDDQLALAFERLQDDLPAVVEPRRTRFVYQDRTSNFIIRPEHKIIFDWLEHGTGNGMIEATAGSGKTSCLIEVLRRIEGQVFFGAFGRLAAEDIKAKAERERLIGYNIWIGTMHGAGMSAWTAHHDHVTVELDKTNRIIESKYGKNHFGETFIRHMVSYGKQALAGVNFPLRDLDRWKALMLHFGAEEYWPENKPIEEGLEQVIAVLESSLDSCNQLVDYDDMLYAPIARDITFRKRDWVLGDEWQDSNPARQALIEHMLSTRGRALFVGDRFQAIFGFTGASADAMDIAKTNLSCHEMSLTTTWRCSEAVVEFAQQWVPHLKARDNAPRGDVRPVTFNPPDICPRCKGEKEIIAGVELAIICSVCGSTGQLKPIPWYLQDRPTKDDFILCRYNRPLIQTAYNLIRDGIACKVLGRDVGRNLVSLATRWKLITLDQLEPRLTNFLIVQTKRARDQNNRSKELEITDRVETLRIFIEKCHEEGKTTIDDLVRAISAVFEDNIKNMITLSSAHKAKGLERMRIYWLQTEIRQTNLKAWEAEQEMHIKYVIATRARLDLIMVPEHIHQIEYR